MKRLRERRMVAPATVATQPVDGARFRVSGMGGGIEGDGGWWGGYGGGGGLRMGPMAYRVFWRISSASRLHVLPSQPVPVVVNPFPGPGTGETKTLISYLP